MLTAEAIDAYLARFTHDVLLDAMLEAWPAYWNRRAQAFLDARPRPDDYSGHASVDELREQWRRLTETAAACRARGDVSPLELIAPEVDAVLEAAS